jgi:hypothetical protein
MNDLWSYYLKRSPEMLLFQNCVKVLSRRELKMKKSGTIIAIAIVSIMLVSSLGLAVNFATAMPRMELTGNRPIEKSWVRLNGVIKTWGTENVSGILQTTARTALSITDNTNQLTSATAIWTENNARPINSVRSKENFTYVYYSARLNNASVSTFNVSSPASNYFLNGTWNLYTVTSTINVITDENNIIVSVHRDQDIKVSKAYGELNVTDNWTKFTLSIDGQDVLAGTIYRSVTRQIAFNPFAVSDFTAVKTSHADLKQMAGCMHAVPGWGGYDSQMDFNGNFKVDIVDLSTVAANM